MSFKAYIDHVLIHDPDSSGFTTILPSAAITKEVNKADSFTFTIYSENAGYSHIRPMVPGAVEVYDGQTPVFRGRILKTAIGWNKDIKVTCESDIALLHDTMVRPYEFNGTPEGLLSDLIDGHNAQKDQYERFTLGEVTVEGTISETSADYPSTWDEIINKLVKKLGGYIRVRRVSGVNYLDYLEDSEETSGQTVTVGSNLLEISNTEKGEQLATGIIPLGAISQETGQRLTIASVNDGKDYLLDSTAAGQLGKIFRTETWDDETVPERLKLKGLERLAEITQRRNSVELTAVDLSTIGLASDDLGFFEYVTVTDTAHQISGDFLVTKKTVSLTDPAACKVTLGKDFNNRISDISEQIEKQKIIVENLPDIPASKITSGTLNPDRLPVVPNSKIGDLDASKITTGTFYESRIPTLDASKIGSGTIGIVRLPDIPASKIEELPAEKITSGTFNESRIPGLNGNKITEGTVGIVHLPDLPASKVTSGEFDTARVPSLPASKIGSGTFDSARIPDLPASKITSGTLDSGRIPSLAASKITSGTFAFARLGVDNIAASSSTEGKVIVKASGYEGALSPYGVKVTDTNHTNTYTNYTHLGPNAYSNGSQIWSLTQDGLSFGGSMKYPASMGLSKTTATAQIHYGSVSQLQKPDSLSTPSWDILTIGSMKICTLIFRVFITFSASWGGGWITPDFSIPAIKFPVSYTNVPTCIVQYSRTDANAQDCWLMASSGDANTLLTKTHSGCYQMYYAGTSQPTGAKYITCSMLVMGV